MSRFLKSFFLYRDRVADFMFLYDPGYTYFFYALKILLSSILSLVVNYHLFGPKILMWAALIPIHFYFLDVLFVDRAHITRRFISFLFGSVCCVLLFYYVYPFDYWLMLPLGILGFFAVIVSIYDLDLQKSINMSILNGLVACAYEKLVPGFRVTDGIGTILIAGTITLFVLYCLRRRKYNQFVRKYFYDLFHTLELVIKNIDNDGQFMQYHHRARLQMDVLRKICNAKTPGNIYVAKSMKRAVFYLYRLEDIYQCIGILYDDSNLDKKEFANIKREIIYNLRQLAGLFDGNAPHIKRRALDGYKGKPTTLINTIKVLYNALESFKRGGEENDYFAEAEEKKSILVLKKTLEWRNDTFRYGIKYALVLMASVFISEFFNIHHGIWITMACVAIVRPSLGGVGHVGRDYAIGGTLGILLGTLIVYVSYPGIVFNILFLLVVFGFVYLRVYAYGFWVCFMMMSFVMMFSSIYGFSLSVVGERLFDVLIAFILSFGIFWFLWPRYSGTQILPNLKKILENLFQSCEILVSHLDSLKTQKRNINQKQKEFFACYNELLVCIDEAKTEKYKGFLVLKNVRKSLKYLNFLNQNTLKLYYFLRDNVDLKTKELYINDLRLIQTRYEMMQRALDNHSFYLKEQKDGRFLSEDKDFNTIIDILFEAQNGLFVALKNNMKLGGVQAEEEKPTCQSGK